MIPTHLVKTTIEEWIDLQPTNDLEYEQGRQFSSVAIAPLTPLDILEQGGMTKRNIWGIRNLEFKSVSKGVVDKLLVAIQRLDLWQTRFAEWYQFGGLEVCTGCRGNNKKRVEMIFVNDHDFTLICPICEGNDWEEMGTSPKYVGGLKIHGNTGRVNGMAKVYAARSA